MKTKMNSSSRNLVITMSILIVVCLVASVICSLLPGKNYTKDYTTYSQVSKITSTYELMDYCHNNGINYSINAGSFMMEGYHITFSLNKAECTIDNNKHMNYFYLLENGKAYNVRTTKNSSGTTVKTYEIKTWGTNYEMCNGSYVLYNMWPALIAFGLAVILVLFLANYLSFCNKCKRCKMCNAQHTSD